jgi:hypothetical protein
MQWLRHMPHACMHACVQEGGEGYDVYVATPEPLNEGEEKHVISAFVADESGIINRVAGVFARRGGAPGPPVWAHAACLTAHVT